MCLLTFGSLNLDNKLLNVLQALMHRKLLWLGFTYLMNIFFILSQYRDVVLALKRGDLRLLRRALQEHEDRYVLLLLFSNSENWCIEKLTWEWTFSPLFYQLLKIRRISSPREARTPSLPKTGKENVSFHVNTFILPELI